MDRPTRILYSTDASIYQVEPLGVIFPRNLDDLSAAVEIASKFNLPLLARGSGSSLAGQAIGEALILDCSRYLTRQIEVNPEERMATVEPGVILTALNHAAAGHGLMFGPDPASAERATMGGSLANNASGAHSILYGMAADHLISVEAILSDGSIANLRPITLQEARRRGDPGQAGSSRETHLYSAAIEIRDRYGLAIRKNWPKTWRRASGYNLNYLLPWTPSQPPGWSETDLNYPPIPPGYINLAPLIAGSEGTLAVIRRATVRLVPRPRHTVLGLLAYGSLTDACKDVEAILEHQPSAVELIPDSLIDLARSVPAYSHLLTFLNRESFSGQTPKAMLVVEFSGDDLQRLRDRTRKLNRDVLVLDSPDQQAQVWGVRKVGLGLLMSRPGDLKPIPFIEDLSVPVANLPEFVSEMQRIVSQHGTRCDYYAHASAGCLHLRPLLDLKTGKGLGSLRSIARQAVALALRLGGAVSGEHGDGLARSEWMELAYGREIMAAFRVLKNAADPSGILNPGKILDAPPMDTNLRATRATSLHRPKPDEWQTIFDYTRQAGLLPAIEQCNGAGVCRKMDGLMCPSFQATMDEMHSTRGRANLLRALMTGDLSDDRIGRKILFEALDLCLACKGCKAECPSSVDMAKLKYEFLHHYYASSPLPIRRPVRDYVFGYIGWVARLAQPLAPLANRILRAHIMATAVDSLLGISKKRKLPELAGKSLYQLAREHGFDPRSAAREESTSPGQPVCIYLSDPFTEYFQPQVGLAALKALKLAGYRVRMLKTNGSVRTLISKGFLLAARRHAARTLHAIQRMDPAASFPVVGVEPSEIYTLRDEFPDLLPLEDGARALAGRAFMIDELLVRPAQAGQTGIDKIAGILKAEHGLQDAYRPPVFLHGHCYQKAQPPAADGYPTGIYATLKMLAAVGYPVSLLDSGCCGMAGAFGYESEHFELSTRIGGIALFPAIRAILKREKDFMIAAPGFSCTAQISDATGISPLHPIQLI